MASSPPESKTMKWHKSLIFKIIFCSIVLIFCLIGSIFYVLDQYQHLIVTEMEKKSAEIVDQIWVSLDTLDESTISSELLKKRFSSLKERPGLDSVTLYDSQRNVVGSLGTDPEPPLEFGSPDIHTLPVPGRHAGSISTWYIQQIPLMVGDKPVGYLDVRLHISPQTQLVKTLQSNVFIALFVLFMTTLCALCYFIFKLLRPLNAMAETCKEISEGNLHEIDIGPNASEVLILEMKFNEMVRALQTKAHMEQKLAQAQRLSALGTLAAGVAHEIGNPLNGIKLTISHLKDMFSRRVLDRDSFDSYADSILDEVGRLDRIVRDFLTLAKERELSLQPYAFDQLVKESVKLIEKDARARGITLKSEIAPFEKDVMVDPQMLKGAIINLLINAMEASDRDSTIKISLTHADGEISLEIADQGQGIPAEVVDRIFDPYFSTKNTGTGLGLPLTRTIIEKHNGIILVKSREGQGTTVTVTLPAEDRAT
jgi:signal transduction histidine kinase